MAFRIPPPWNPDYALPSYAANESLQMRAYITKWTPRGTYDDPDVCDPSWDNSYATPEYIKAEGYGQGAYVTEWAPRGFYVGQVARKARAIKRDQVANGVNVMPGPFAEYGRQSTAILIESVRRLPPGLRKEGLRKLMTAMDPGLYDKATRYAQHHADRGLQSNTAVELGIARAMSEGIAAEIVQVGKKSKRPSAKGQLGLACYGCGAVMGLGQVSKAGAFETTVSAITTAITVAKPQAGQCTSDGLNIWKVGADGFGYWARRSVNDVCTSTFTGAGPTTGGVQGGITGAEGPLKEAPVIELKMIQVGQFLVPLNVASFHIRWGGVLPAEWQGGIIAELQTGSGDDVVDAKPGSIWNRLRDFIPNLPMRINQTYVGIVDGPRPGVTAPRGYSGDVLNFPKRPVVSTKRPDTGENWGLYMWVTPDNPSKTWDSTTNPYVLEFEWKKVGAYPGDYTIFSKIADVAKEVYDAIGDAACAMLSSGAAKPAAGVVSTYYTGSSEAGTKGVDIAKGSCGAPPPPPGEGAAADWFLPVAIAGGALLALYAFLPHKKKKAGTP